MILTGFREVVQNQMNIKHLIRTNPLAIERVIIKYFNRSKFREKMKNVFQTSTTVNKI